MGVSPFFLVTDVLPRLSLIQLHISLFSAVDLTFKSLGDRFYIDPYLGFLSLFAYIR